MKQWRTFHPYKAAKFIEMTVCRITPSKRKKEKKGIKRRVIFFERWQRIDLQETPRSSWLRITRRQSMVIEVTVKPKRKDRRTKCGEFIFGVETPVCVSPADQRLSRRSPPRRYAYPFPICVLPTIFDRILFPSIPQLPLFSFLSFESIAWIQRATIWFRELRNNLSIVITNDFSPKERNFDFYVSKHFD